MAGHKKKKKGNWEEAPGGEEPGRFTRDEVMGAEPSS